MTFKIPAAFLLLLLIAACGGAPRLTAQTPAMVSVRYPSGSDWQQIVDMAERHCNAHGKNAVLIWNGQKIQSNRDLAAPYRADFECTP